MTTIKRHSREADIRDLNILHLRENRGLSMTPIARAVGTTKNTAIGVCYRAHNEPQVPCECVKPENTDGGMAKLWWAE